MLHNVRHPELSYSVTNDRFSSFPGGPGLSSLRINVIRKVLDVDHARCFLAFCGSERWNGDLAHRSAFSAVAGFSPKYFSHTWLSGTVADPYSAINKNIVFIFTSYHNQATTVAPQFKFTIHVVNSETARQLRARNRRC